VQRHSLGVPGLGLLSVRLVSGGRRPTVFVSLDHATGDGGLYGVAPGNRADAGVDSLDGFARPVSCPA